MIHPNPADDGVVDPRYADQLPDLGLLAKIRSEIRAFRAARSDDRWHAEMKSRVAREIGPFLGSNGARMLLQPVAENGRNLLSTIEPVLAEFLGPRAASELVSHVVDTSIVGC